ncbi:MAG: hypothetical protein ACYTFA_11690, partial [Planctomycetota bacterium]
GRDCYRSFRAIESQPGALAAGDGESGDLARADQISAVLNRLFVHRFFAGPGLLWVDLWRCEVGGHRTAGLAEDVRGYQFVDDVPRKRFDVAEQVVTLVGFQLVPPAQEVLLSPRAESFKALSITLLHFRRYASQVPPLPV